VSVAPEEAAAALVTATPAVEATAAGAPHTGLAGEVAAGAIAGVEATQTATSRRRTRRLRCPPQN
jgi:hypothetical protein